MSNVSFATTLLVRDNCLCFAAQRAARALSRRFDRALHPMELTNGQFSLLMSLNRPQAPNLGSVAELLAMDRTTLTAALKPLERRGLVVVTVDRRDRRNHLVSLTDAGRDRLAKALPIWTREHRRLERQLDSPAVLRDGLAALACAE